ncbi:MAG: diaminopimelate epimerase [Acidobacteria bacterium]|nr:diaminopimelate epimerase [Acidobacteriota bacterium]
MTSRAAGLAFQKVCGGGNDFILVDSRDLAMPPQPADLARDLCRRALSIGADGLVWIRSSTEAELAVDYFNADGTRAFCGNGTLCAARWAHERAGFPATLRLETDQGVLDARVSGSRVKLAVPAPPPPRDGLSLEAAGLPGTGLAINTGCPHLVVLMDRLPDDAQFAAAAPILRHHPDLAPAGANVDFVEVIDPHRLRVRTFERGVEGETLASGTGCLAAALAAASRSLAASPVTCQVRGGSPLKVRFTRTAQGFENVSLEGEARLIASGTVEADAF